MCEGKAEFIRVRASRVFLVCGTPWKSSPASASQPERLLPAFCKEDCGDLAGLCGVSRGWAGRPPHPGRKPHLTVRLESSVLLTRTSSL